MTGFRVGIMDFNLVSRPTAESLTRVGYLNALANRIDSFWVPDHLNGLFPRSLWKQKYCGATKLVPTLGRAILGLGPGEREGNEPYGVDWSKPVARFEEALATIRALWDSGGALVNRDSPFFPLHNAVFDLWPYR